MATRYYYQRERGDDLIKIECDYLDFTGEKRMINLALDTGATHTVFDINELYVNGYRIEQSVGRTNIHTGKGIV